MAVIIDPTIAQRQSLVDSIDFLKGQIEITQKQLAAAERSVAFNASIGQTSPAAASIPGYKAEIAQLQAGLATQQQALQQFDSGTTGATTDPAPVAKGLVAPAGNDTAAAAAAAASTPTAAAAPVIEQPSMLIPAIGVAPANTSATPASNTEAGKLLAQRQTALDAQKRLPNNTGDWRVRISLAAQSTYLYNAPSAERGILAPLAATHGVIFPYTPKIDVGYRAMYNPTDLTHSNYTNYFYQSSSVGQVRISGSFTAQDTVEAQYLLAVIHFFRSATKMFYGQDAERGAPPPLLFVSGLGEYQFNNHPCVLTNFEYSLPADVDYIRAGSPNQNGTDLLKRRTSTQNNLPTNPISGALTRLNQLFSGQKIQKGGIVSQPSAPNFSKNSPTYVPTKIEISVSLLPIVTRNQASRQFSLKQFANGALVKQGFW
jgi:hypothetical protein